ncbi:ArgS-related anticodon-binding protein NrtL [Streptomyces sp. NPDC047123]|uniref:ArgS-related anticodon-binding protein NrtL n=1 Tax=Streptomyces sp. NPDC047123 TaxID=3155622 RepID=UPI0033C50335
MTPVELSRTVLRAMRRAVDAGELQLDLAGAREPRVERPGPGGCGDYATGVALQLARAAGRSPRQVADVLSPRLAAEPGIAGVDITGPGFLNITLAGARSETLVREVLARGGCYGHVHPDTGALTQLHVPREVRAVVLADSVSRILRSQGTLVRVTCDEAPDPAWVDALGVRINAYGRPPEPLPVLRPVPAGADPLALGRDAARWALLHPAAHDHPRITPEQGGDAHLAQRESNPLFRVRYAHARCRALSRNAADLGFDSAPGPLGSDASRPLPERPPGDGSASHAAGQEAGSTQADLGRDAMRSLPERPPGDGSPSHEPAPDEPAPHKPAPRADRTPAHPCPAPRADDTPAHPGPAPTHPLPAGPAAEQALLDVLADHPAVLAGAARHHAPDRLARHLVTTADAFLSFQSAPDAGVLPLGDEKPSATHRARLALAEAAGTVLAGGLSLLGIGAPEFL